jgi:hypothetical protein
MSTETILEYLRTVSNRNLWHNGLMHVAILIAILVVFVSKNRRARRIAGDGVLFALFSSVIVVGVLNGNPFHVATMLPLALGSLRELLRGRSDYDFRRSAVPTALGALSIAIGFCYPDFVEASPIARAALAPVGIVPCPTLLVGLGFLALTPAREGRALRWAAAAIGLFYGATGVFALKVNLDAALLAIAAFSAYRLIGVSFRASPARAAAAAK